MVTRARMFQFKPNGDVTLTKAQDAVGLPAPLMQDPIHYPHGTKFMAPGAPPATLIASNSRPLPSPRKYFPAEFDRPSSEKLSTLICTANRRACLDTSVRAVSKSSQHWCTYV